MGLNGLVLTEKGSIVLAKAEEAEEALSFEYISIGDGKTGAAFDQMEKMVNERFRLPILKHERDGSTLTLTADFSSAEITEKFYFRELGVIANGILYAYSNAGDEADLMEPNSSALLCEMRISCVLCISGRAEVSVELKSGLYALQSELQAANLEISELKENIIPGYVTGTTFEINAQGWYRIAESTGANGNHYFSQDLFENSCTINIKTDHRWYSNEYKKIQLLNIHSKQKFICLTNYSDTNKLDKIRLAYDELNQKYYIEIHYNQNDAITVIVSIEDAIGLDNDANWKAIKFERTEETVSGVEVKASLDLPDNFDAGDLLPKKGYGRRKGSAVGINSFAFGKDVEASGDYSTAIGEGVVASGRNSFAAGYYNADTNVVASGEASHAEGIVTLAEERGAHAEGSYTRARKQASHTEGLWTEVTGKGENGHAEGTYTMVTGYSAHAEGHCTIADSKYGHAAGMYNKSMVPDGSPSQDSYHDTLHAAYVIGNGTANDRRSNAFRVTFGGDTYGLGAFNSSGADYAEFIKPWADGNPCGEDRVGYFVTVENGFLEKANEGDYIAGITSGNPSVVGNADEDYYWRYERDELNRIVMEDVPEMVQKTDEDGNLMFDKKTHEPIMAETGKIIKNARMKLADGYDPSLQNSYVERKFRKEWDYVGMVGVLPVRDDGTCIPGKFCRCGVGGVATLAERRDFDVYMVIERITESIVSVILK